MDTKRKGVNIYCVKYHKKTHHATITDKKEKLTWLLCECGEWKLIDKWS